MIVAKILVAVTVVLAVAVCIKVIIQSINEIQK